MSWLIAEPLLLIRTAVLAVAITEWTWSMDLRLYSASQVYWLLHTDALRRFSHSHIHRHSHAAGGVAPSEFGDRSGNHSHTFAAFTFTWMLQRRHRFGVQWLTRILQGSGISRLLLLRIRLPGASVQADSSILHPSSVFTLSPCFHKCTTQHHVCLLSTVPTNFIIILWALDSLRWCH